MSEIALKTNHLKKVYEVGEQKVEALKDVTISIEEGSFVALTGTSGSGKSTLMHCLGGLDIPTSGEVYIHDIDLCKCKEKQLAKVRREEIGFMFQNFSLLEELSVKENIVLPVLLAGGKVDEEYINGLMEQLGIADRQKHTPAQLSGGQQQRVAIARALANDPAVILCDEPTGNLDHKTSEEVMELLHDIHQTYHKTCLIVTHDREVAKGADYILQIEDGMVKE
ncbi:MAG: ABC transporter ATP-binding protein [Lachnospiraceae bacterium]|nr:ABC transporter ATP-binding protein [Lachnospiraceae bacterium]